MSITAATEQDRQTEGEGSMTRSRTGRTYSAGGNWQATRAEYEAQEARRNRQIARRHAQGETLRSLATEFRVSYQRIQQIAKRWQGR